MRSFTSLNPYTQQVFNQTPFHHKNQLKTLLNQSQQALPFLNPPPAITAQRLYKLSQILDANASQYAQIITQEMGKPINQAIGEVKKSASHCRYYADQLPKLKQSQRVQTDSLQTYISKEPLGKIMLILPFNFPFWLAFKSGIPMLCVGNSVLCRPADSCPLIGQALEELFLSAGFPKGGFQTVFNTVEDTEFMIEQTEGVSFTGSSATGKIIGGLAGKHLKKSVLELGGTDGFLVLEDADVKKAVHLAVKSRLSNGGQVCIAAKRFIVHTRIYQTFVNELESALKQVVMGDPMDSKTTLGPLAREDLVTSIENQVNESIRQGATLKYRGEIPKGNGFFYPPVLLEVDRNNIAFKEEFFGPVFAVSKFSTEEEGIDIMNDSKYGLGATIVCKDIERAQNIAKKIQSGAVAINEMMRSDSKMPSGGCKQSGYGRECGSFGYSEFANIKSTFVSKL